MSRMLTVRSDGGRGGVSVCDGCEDVHVRWGETTLSLDRAAFRELVRMMGDAVAVLAPARTH
jgi:hypothetical protein